MSELLWEDLLRTSLIGTDRSRTPMRVRHWLKERDIYIPEEPGRALLASVAAYRLMRRAATGPGKRNSPMPEAISIEQENQSPVTLGRLLEAPYRNALPEFVALCRASGSKPPPESLPALFDYALKHEAIRAELPALTGARGQWLLRQNPAWASLRSDLGPDQWDQLDISGRRGLLVNIRQTDPEQGRDLLVAAWPELDWKEKVLLLGSLRVGLEHADEAFLEMARQDGRLEVRKKAAELLLLCPASRVSDSAWKEMQNLVAWQRSGIAVQLPEEPAPFLQEYRLQDSAEAKGLSLRESLLYFRMATLPVAEWSADRPASQWLAGAEMADHGDVLLRAWWQANQRDLHPEWCRAWVEWLLDQGRLPDWVMRDELEPLLQMLDARSSNALLRTAVRQNEGLLREGSPVHLLLMASPHPWEEDLSRAIIDPFESFVAGASEFYWNTWHYRDLLRLASFRIWPGLYEELSDRWGRGGVAWGMWDREIGYLLDILSFRAGFTRDLMNG